MKNMLVLSHVIKIRSQRIRKVPLIILLGLLMPSSLLAESTHPFDQLVDHPEIAIYDEQGNNVLDSGKPYSPKQTCGTCHDYDSITHAYHFEMGRDEADDNYGPLRGMAQLSSPGYFGGYNCMSGNSPAWLAKKQNSSKEMFADYGTAGMVASCAGCHSGGGWMEKDRNGNRYDETNANTAAPLDGDYFNRGSDTNNQKTSNDEIHQWDWKKSGVVENDCFMCHTDIKQLHDYNADQPYRSRIPLDLYTRGLRQTALLNEGFFRYAPTAALQYIDMDKSESSIAEKPLVDFNWNKESGSLVLDNSGQPLLTWNRDAFNDKGKVVIPMLRFPANDNCMMCHRTSNSRRGFYGFGENAEAVFDEDGILQEDYQDDVHKGKTWVADNGEERQIENCNSCHSRAYFRSEASNIDLDANHNFLKGNSDMDVRNDLDNSPNATTCTYCHDEAKNPAIPSGQADILSAHRELWKNNGDMKGYLASNIDRITQTHLDVVSCQGCHITNKVYRGNPVQIMYRYRRDGDNKQRITPYNAKPRYVWKDQNTGYVLSRIQRNSVFEQIDPDDCSKGGRIVEPVSKQQIATVTARVSHGSCRYGDPQSYEAFVGLKKAYDALLVSEGFNSPDTALVWGEINNYVMSHNSRPAPQAVQCGDCHNKKQNDSFSALVAENGILGGANSKLVMALPDRRLVDEGIIQMAQPYIKMEEQVQSDGSKQYVLTENVRDILAYTKFDGSMTAMGAERARAYEAEFRKLPLESANDNAHLPGEHQEIMARKMASAEVHFFKPQYGLQAIRQAAIFVQSNDQSDLTYPTYRVRALVNDEQLEIARRSGLDNFASDFISLEMFNSNKQNIGGMILEPLVVKIPYLQNTVDAKALSIGYSSNGNEWNTLSSAEVLAVQPKTEDQDGYLLFQTNKLGHFVAMDSNLSARSTTDARAVDEEQSGSGTSSNGAMLILLPLLVILAIMRRRREFE